MKLLCVAFGCALLMAQSFDVASVKRVPPDAPRTGLVRKLTPTSLSLRNASLGNCIAFAYGFEHARVIGPEWRDYPTDVRFDIEAKTPEPVSEQQIRLMLRDLLGTRLGLAVHTEQRDLPFYALVVGRDGTKFQRAPATEESARKPVAPFVTRFENSSMEQLAATMGPPFTSYPVVDETGLEGGWDFQLDLSPFITDPITGKGLIGRNGAIDMENAYLQALPKQLGLRLEKKIAAAEVLVIDRVRKEPTPN